MRRKSIKLYSKFIQQLEKSDKEKLKLNRSASETEEANNCFTPPNSPTNSLSIYKSQMHLSPLHDYTTQLSTSVENKSFRGMKYNLIFNLL